MRKLAWIRPAIFLSVLAILITALPSEARSHHTPPFQYVGGTEPLPEHCRGKLELRSEALVFECSKGSVTAPFDAITLMQYRSQVSKQVRKMKLNWAVQPPVTIGKHNVFFTVLYRQGGETHAMILRALPDTMRPYLAEIELRMGRRVEVERSY